MEKEKIINITESELRELLASTLDGLVEELISRVEDERSAENPTEAHVNDPADSDETADTGESENTESDDHVPVEKPSANGSDRNITTGYIAAVRGDGERFRIRDQWYKVTGSTRIETDLAKGMKVKVYFSHGDHCVFANAIYDASAQHEAVAS